MSLVAKMLVNCFSCVLVRVYLPEIYLAHAQFRRKDMYCAELNFMLAEYVPCILCTWGWMGLHVHQGKGQHPHNPLPDVCADCPACPHIIHPGWNVSL